MSPRRGLEDVGLQGDGSKCRLGPKDGGAQNRVALMTRFDLSSFAFVEVG
jgi:hypothetical protein